MQKVDELPPYHMTPANRSVLYDDDLIATLKASPGEWHLVETGRETRGWHWGAQQKTPGLQVATRKQPDATFHVLARWVKP